MTSLAERVDGAIAEVPDFPKPGIVFKDITPVLRDPVLFREVIVEFAAQSRRLDATVIAGIESRGFVFASVLAQELELPCVLIRKPGKLPRAVHRVTYELEYGTDTIEIHRDDCGAGDRVIVVDDLLATGGTAAAATELVAQTGAEMAGVLFMIELGFLKGRARLDGHEVYSIVNY